MRDVGQISVAFADAMNTQNKLGMDLDGQIGGNIFDIPSFRGLAYESTSGDYIVTGQLTEGKGAELTDADYRIEVMAVSAGVPTQIKVTLLTPDGTPKKDGMGQDIVDPSVAVTAGFAELAGGIEVNFSGSDAYTVGNEFLIQPAKNVASNIEMATNRPEDLAFANPVRAGADSTNLGSANVTDVTVSNTEVGFSAFDSAGGLLNAAPAQISFTAADTYEVLDGSGNV